MLLAITILFGGLRPEVNFDPLQKEVRIAIDIPLNGLIKVQNVEALFCKKAD